MVNVERDAVPPAISRIPAFTPAMNISVVEYLHTIK